MNEGREELSKFVCTDTCLALNGAVTCLFCMDVIKGRIFTSELVLVSLKGHSGHCEVELYGKYKRN